MKVAVLAAGNPLDVSTWSGTPYYMTMKLLSRYPDLTIIKSPRPIWATYARKITRRATRGHIDIYWSQALARLNAAPIKRVLKQESVDITLCIGNAPISAALAEEFPFIHVSDATVPLMRDYYREFSDLPKALQRSAHAIDRRSVLASRACLYPTAWAAKSAIRDYGADPARVHVIPWGGNLPPDTVFGDAGAHRSATCELVFVGVDWQRKGGHLAVAAAKRLAADGRPVKLHLIGSSPGLKTDGPIVVHGFIDKKTPEGIARLARIMRQASFLFVPTRQDCYGMIFPEANAFGVPAITTQTGGVGDVVVEGINGHLLPEVATADDYARLIWTVWSDPERYTRLRETSRRRYREVLNWDSWLTRVSEIFENAMGSMPEGLGEKGPDDRRILRVVGR